MHISNVSILSFIYLGPSWSGAFYGFTMFFFFSFSFSAGKVNLLDKPLFLGWPIDYFVCKSSCQDWQDWYIFI